MENTLNLNSERMPKDWAPEIGDVVPWSKIAATPLEWVECDGNGTFKDARGQEWPIPDLRPQFYIMYVGK